MLSLKAWAKRRSGQIKIDREVQALSRESALIKVENVSSEQISRIDLNHYWIYLYYFFLPKSHWTAKSDYKTGHVNAP
jgi:hypothetical protein